MEGSRSPRASQWNEVATINGLFSISPHSLTFLTVLFSWHKQLKKGQRNAFVKYAAQVKGQSEDFNGTKWGQVGSRRVKWGQVGSRGTNRGQVRLSSKMGSIRQCGDRFGIWMEKWLGD